MTSIKADFREDDNTNILNTFVALIIRVLRFAIGSHISIATKKLPPTITAPRATIVSLSVVILQIVSYYGAHHILPTIIVGSALWQR